MKLLLVILISLQSLLFAVEPIKKGDPSPHDGVVFTNQEANDLVKTDQKVIKLEQLQIKYEEKIGLQDQRIDLLRTHIKDNQELSPMGKLGWFFVGFVGGSLMFYMSAKATKDFRN